MLVADYRTIPAQLVLPVFVERGTLRSTCPQTCASHARVLAATPASAMQEAKLKDARAAAVDGSDGASAAARAGSYISTLALKPPKIIRLPSKGIDLGFIIEASRGSFIAFAFTRSRSFFDL